MADSNCLFCKIATGEIKTEKVHDDGRLFAIKDINPAAPVHFLVIPHKHIETILDVSPAEEELIGSAYMIANGLARREGVDENGFRVVVNCNRDGGQSVYHVHFHVLGGRRFAWPPG